MTGQMQVLHDNDPSWSKVPYQVILGKKFTTLRESLEYTVNTWGGYAKTGSPKSSDLFKIPGAYTPPEWGDPVDAVGANRAIYDAPARIFYQDTRLGANDAINCFFQFNRDDDIVHPATYSQVNGYYGEGRIYNDTTHRNQTLAYFTFGIPQYTNIGTFLLKSVYEPLARTNASGYDRSGVFSLGKLFGDATALAFSICIIPYRMFKAAANWLTTQRVSKFVEFKSEMSAYYSYVDSMLAQWLVATGLYGNGASEATTGESDTGFFGRIFKNFTPGWSSKPDSLPPVLRITGPSIYDIMKLKSRILGLHAMGGGYSAITSRIDEIHDRRTKPGAGEVDPYYDDSTADEFSPWSGERLIPNDTGDSSILFETTKSTAVGATQYIGFRIEKTTSSSESFSNSTKASSIAETVNSQIKSAREKSIMLEMNEAKQTAAEADTFSISNIADFIKGAVTSLTSWVGAGSVTSALTTSAYIDIPDEYSDSSYNKSFSISLQLRSPYGDIVSIYQSIIVPMFMILAGALPRAAGEHSYQSPFLLRAYCAGRFSIPLGIIESVSVTRGSSDFGWTYQNLPTCVDITISIKDLSSMMYMAMKGSEISNYVSLDDSNFNEYINTLAGVGLAERVNTVLQANRKAQLAAHQFANKWTNPAFWGTFAGNSAIGQAVGLVVSDSAIPRS